MYLCGTCGSLTRFPRYNAAAPVLARRRGRCGEYDMLLFRTLRALGHRCRWVLDWGDHVWAEVWLEDGEGIGRMGKGLTYIRGTHPGGSPDAFSGYSKI